MLAARALVFPSVCHEAGPLAPIEAAAAGLPMIVSSRVGVAHHVEESRAGWTVPPGDVAALADALARLSDGAALDAAGLCARAMYEGSHSDAAAYDSLLEVYERVRPAGPPSPAPA
jgi:glycosyltransferase involved in cell wall biosynthesis